MEQRMKSLQQSELRSTQYDYYLFKSNTWSMAMVADFLLDEKLRADADLDAAASDLIG